MSLFLTYLLQRCFGFIGFGNEGQKPKLALSSRTESSKPELQLAASQGFMKTVAFRRTRGPMSLRSPSSIVNRPHNNDIPHPPPEHHIQRLAKPLTHYIPRPQRTKSHPLPSPQATTAGLDGKASINLYTIVALCGRLRCLDISTGAPKQLTPSVKKHQQPHKPLTDTMIFCAK